MALLALGILILLLAIVLLKFTFLAIRLPIPLASFFDFSIRRPRRRHLQLMAWTRRHGPFFFTLNGLHRNFVSSDPAVMAEVFGRDQFAHFPERKGPISQPPHLRHVFVASGQRWKELRRKVSHFSVQNLRSLEPLLEEAVQDMLEGMATHQGGGGEGGGGPFDFLRYSNLLFAGLLSRLAFFTAFPNRQLAEFSREYVKRAEELIGERDRQKGEEEGRMKGGRAIFGRKKKANIFGTLHGEMLQKGGGNEQVEKGTIEGKKERMERVLGRLLLDGSMKAVGIETICFALACAIHFLSVRPTLQAQLRAERILQADPPLLKAVIQETLRLCPIVSFANSRLCISSTLLLSNGTKMAKGDTFEGDIFSLGRDTSFWGQNANQFLPERWLGNNCPKGWQSYWLPFGIRGGPRACVGIPLALLLLKMALGSIFGRFQLASLEEEETEPNLVGTDVLVPNSVRVRIIANE